MTPSWLFPVTKGGGDKDRETNSTSVLLAALQGVPEFGRSLLQKMGAPAGRLETFVEVSFDLGDAKVRPDGLLKVTRGKTSWTALVEVKTGHSKLDNAQVDRYHEVAQLNQFDAVLTISSQLVSAWGVLPVVPDKKLSKKIGRFHMSWSLIHTEALLLDKNNSVKDPTQAWVLSEFLRYLDEKNSGPLDFYDLGESWDEVNRSVISSMLRPQDRGAEEVADHYLQLTRFLAMELSRELGVPVQQLIAKKDRADIQGLVRRMATDLAEAGKLTAAISVPNAASAVFVTSDLRAQVISCSARIDAPLKERASTRANWLLRQLREAPGSLLIQVNGPRKKDCGPVVTLEQALTKPELLMKGIDFEIAAFTLTLLTKTNFKKSAFIENAVEAVNRFYQGVVQNLKIWIPPAPKVRPEIPEADGETLNVLTDETGELSEDLIEGSIEINREL
jgi:hypothetical protein